LKIKAAYDEAASSWRRIVSRVALHSAPEKNTLPNSRILRRRSLGLAIPHLVSRTATLNGSAVSVSGSIWWSPGTITVFVPAVIGPRYKTTGLPLSCTALLRTRTMLPLAGKKSIPGTSSITARPVIGSTTRTSLCFFTVGSFP